LAAQLSDSRAPQRESNQAVAFSDDLKGFLRNRLMTSVDRPPLPRLDSLARYPLIGASWENASPQPGVRPQPRTTTPANASTRSTSSSASSAPLAPRAATRRDLSQLNAAPVFLRSGDT
jgi:hypothetical protein